MNNSGALFKDIILILFGKFAFKYGLSKAIRKTKGETAIFTKIAK